MSGDCCCGARRVSASGPKTCCREVDCREATGSARGAATRKHHRAGTDSGSVNPELHSAIEWVAQRCFEVIDGAYDRDYEAEHQLLLSYDDGEVRVRPVQGFKQVPQ